QPHYDFGLRALKSVLVAACEAKRQLQNQDVRLAASRLPSHFSPAPSTLLSSPPFYSSVSSIELALAFLFPPLSLVWSHLWRSTTSSASSSPPSKTRSRPSSLPPTSVCSRASSPRRLSTWS